MTRTTRNLSQIQSALKRAADAMVDAIRLIEASNEPLWEPHHLVLNEFYSDTLKLGVNMAKVVRKSK